MPANLVPLNASPLIRPDWQNNFACLPATLASLLGCAQQLPELPPGRLGPAAQYEAVALIFVDAFGWRFLKHFTENDPIPALCSMVKHGTLSPLSSQFPSTTAVHVTTINTGLSIAQSGVCEWHYYESRLDRVITPLPFFTPHDSRPDALTRHGIRPEHFLPPGWFYPQLKRAGVDPVILQRQAYSLSPYAQALQGPARAMGFQEHHEGLDLLGELLSQVKQKTYAYYYFEDFDSKMHHTGVLSRQSARVIRHFFGEFERRVVRPVKASGKRVLFVFTADHGMTKVRPERTVYLDRDFPDSPNWLRETAAGQTLYPCGSSRDLFLHLKPECKQAATSQLRTALSGLAEVLDVDQLLAGGTFGPHPDPVLGHNLGDLLIAPYAGESVYWSGPGHCWKQGFLAHHGGLTPEEMESFLLAFPSQ